MARAELSTPWRRASSSQWSRVPQARLGQARAPLWSAFMTSLSCAQQSCLAGTGLPILHGEAELRESRLAQAPTVARTWPPMALAWFRCPVLGQPSGATGNC